MRYLFLTLLMFWDGCHDWPVTARSVAEARGAVAPLELVTGARCTAVVIGPGVALTAAHCFTDTHQGWLAGRAVVAVEVHPTHDIARFRFEGGWSGAVALLDPREPQGGEVLVLRGFGCSTFSRELAFVRRHSASPPVAPHDLVFRGRGCRGDSGGPVLDEHGAVRAIAWGINADQTIVLGTDLLALDGL